MSECSICHEDVSDRVMMTCKAAHSFCFKCILIYVEKNMALKSCPNCRGGNKFIMIPTDNGETETETSRFDFYSLRSFQESLSILQKIKKLDSDNSCLVPESVLLLYILNKESLSLAKKILDSNEFNYEIKDLVKLLKWNTRPTRPTGSIPGFIGSSVPLSSSPNSTINQMASEVVGNFISNELSGMFSTDSENPDTPRQGSGTGPILEEMFYSFYPRQQRH